ncbi:PTS sugar transporter subunit IIC [Enterococcus saccharolyticus]|uniref:PTS mannose/fructose/sorbose/N-acetylgalactosamine transporter subunit IIC n=1 Tax=Enterococcus saccharolyticus TaxID=41997 RepID=UPI001E3A640E|nr:PTS sugar transporter subunit IIC [Enterococcus saccharolyticus]MCD5001973.1 PTS sugar transporter subunit IIC [Enterococcus saccharolyticus]
MSLVQALLIAAWAGYCSYDDVAPQMLRRPLLVGPLVGLILGDMTTALIISATLELMWMGLGNMAGYQTPDMIVGTILGVTVSITSGTGASPEGIAAGVAAATTVAILVQQLLVMTRVLKQFFEPWANRLAKEGDLDGMMKINLVALVIQFLLRAVPTFIVVYFQAGVVDRILNVVPDNVLGGLGIASAILPAVGLSILMTLMMEGILWPFLLLGFVLSGYLELGILPITLISLSFAIIYSFIMEIIDRQNDMASVPTGGAVQNIDEDEGYDL